LIPSLSRSLFRAAVILVGTVAGAGAQPANFPPLGPVPIPAQNPMTPEKVVLGKILFWEEQLSSDDAVACATCHLPEFGGSDPRSVGGAHPHPGPDGAFGTGDDILGSPGVARMGCDGTPVSDPTFGFDRQVTDRRTPSMINSAYAPLLFWDGRASGTFLDPESGSVVIPSGGALESQAIAPILSSVEMACGTRSWLEVRQKLEVVTPLFYAADLTPDITAALLADPTYPELFEAAFGTPEITAVRLGLAIAAYERTLISDQSPFDTFLQTGGGLTPIQQQGFQEFANHCTPCHAGPLLTDHSFQHIGVRPTSDDLGRRLVTGNTADSARFKTPSLRNLALRAPFFHNGGKQTIAEVVEFYDDGGDFAAPDLPPINLNFQDEQQIIAFLTGALTDPRVAQGLPPFDHPTFRRHFRRGDANEDGAVDLGDVLATLDYLFQGGAAPGCSDAADADDDGVLTISDPIAVLLRLFAGAPPLPAPSDTSTGPDPTPDALPCS